MYASSFLGLFRTTLVYHADLVSKFISSSATIPGIGNIELSWVNTPLPLAQTPQKAVSDGGDITMGDGVNGGGAGDQGRQAQTERAEVDYDVADDDDRWMAE